MHTRRYPRFALDRPLTVTVFWDDTPIRTLRGRCRILAEGGLGAVLHDQLYVGEVLRLEMPPLSRAYASVRSVSGSQYGLGFLYLSEGQRRAVHSICESADPAANA